MFVNVVVGREPKPFQKRLRDARVVFHPYLPVKIIRRGRALGFDGVIRAQIFPIMK